MIIYRSNQQMHNSVDAAERVKRVLDLIEGNEVKITEHLSAALTEYTRFQRFIENAVGLGMLLVVEKKSGCRGGLYYKTNIYPTFVEIPPTKRKPNKPKQGDGSVLKPKFNISIYPTDNNKRKEINRLAPLGKSKLPIIGRAEDAGLYDVPADTSDRIRYLKQLRMAAQARAKNEAAHG
jgi:hypothetical protein